MTWKLRIENKLDLIIRALQHRGIMFPTEILQEVGNLKDIEQDPCPVCGHQYRIVLNFDTEEPELQCGCVPPKTVVKGLKEALTHEESNNASRWREEASEVPPEYPTEGDRVSGGQAPPGPGHR